MSTHRTYNPIFKRPGASDRHPGRSPSPPRRYVEPLSPKKPAPLEPSYNYPALNNHVDYQVRPEAQYITTPQQRQRSDSYRSGHHRTPSTIDTLAEAALALSPAYNTTQPSPAWNGFRYPALPRARNGTNEPPHKRARSEIYPSPLVGQYASRPATSYEQSNAWSGDALQQSHTGDAYDSRVEEAALLLNFRTGGWPNHARPVPQSTTTEQQAAIGLRPHANSFPQDAQHTRPVELTTQSSLLPPFNPQDSSLPRPTLPSPKQSREAPLAKPTTTAQHAPPPVKPEYRSQSMSQLPSADVDMPDAPSHLPSPPEHESSRAVSTDVPTSETSEITAKSRRSAVKSKSKTTGTRKSMNEKAATKRAASRKKTPDVSKGGKSKVSVTGADWAVKPDLNRRKSFSSGPQAQKEDGQTQRGQSVPPEVPMVVRPTPVVKEAKPARRNKLDVTSDTVCAGCETARETAKANPELDEWVCCNGCKRWYHVDCAGFTKASEVRDVDKFFCKPCEPAHGKTTYVRKSTRAHASVDYAELQRGVLKTSEESTEHHYVQPIKDGTFQFDPESFPRMRPELVTREFFERSSTFTEPICIPAEWNPRPWLRKRQQQKERDGFTHIHGDNHTDDMAMEDYEYDVVSDEGQDKLDMVMPEDLTVRQVCNMAGPETPLDVIDVKTQNSGAKWTLGRWADYYEETGDDKPIRNVISLEVSQTKLGRLLRRPKVVRDIDLQDEVWPQEEKDKGKWPKVQYYCLMSAADSYTDFHIDFGGSSVYYHILKGKKTFFFIPPKPKHLKAYEEWNDSPQQNYTFLPNITGECYRVDLHEGDTMLIPSGWIHAVWTPATSLVIGGNFLTRMSYKNQFRVVEIEKANETPMKFRYPFFQKIMWYTAIKYMRDDPMPEEVSQAFQEGQKYDRRTPIWADFDGDLATSDNRVGANNARYYSQAEIEGLPELVTFIFQTVMLVMGRIEGITQDRMKRVNASIPKGHGEPLEVAKRFALWVAWKRGNEDPPAWSHPNAVLPNSKEDGPPKKMSARALKDLERKEAIAAWRVAPDRQSARVKSATAATSISTTPGASVATAATPDRATSFAPSHPSTQPPKIAEPHQTMAVQAPQMAPPMALMMNGIAGQYLSTPKTSVLGPKRVACDTCRKRRIRCKHKDLVMQATPENINGFQNQLSGFAGQDTHDNVAVTPPKTNHHFATDAHNGMPTDGAHGLGPLPGTGAYLNANIPMTMNGVAMFGDSGKRGRTKACVECRRSKRRCVHDENGNVDPVKAAETPVPRGSVPSKKRSIDGDGTPTQARKKSKASSPSDSVPLAPAPAQLQQPSDARESSPHPQFVQNESTYPSHSFHSTPMSGQSPSQHSHSSHEQQHHGSVSLDPSLYAYPEPDANDEDPYASNGYPYPSSERPSMYQLPSLEQIANEVLDMNGDYRHDPMDNVHVYNPDDIGGPMNSKPDESVDSAISLPGSDISDGKRGHEGATEAIAQPSVERDDAPDHRPVTPVATTSPVLHKNGVNDLPLFRPPALQVSESPEQTRRQLPAQSPVAKRKRTSISEAASQMSHKRSKFGGSFEESMQQPVLDDDAEFARVLQAENNGLRRRTSLVGR
ncbi:Putative zn(2)-C6 fungal-type DNA-binding domain, Zinc finger, PHD-type, JmjC [Septoria linicola]|uniref:JmjC domain-containing histone demethylation protein 1 n=1 Tax=Septoria linicola TaxID=215465 RepID=A0A9Q9EM66_9PEZI|nr:Putative zn(2)-C6 fungal-type DNA-binding domain, Zinc finger, PHD-type, JmjC [Septoria linicola]